MRYLDEFYSGKFAKGLVDEIKSVSKKKIKLMEVCGTHTVAIFKHGLRQLMPENITLLSGPGCPVCVTPNETIDKAIWLGGQMGVIWLPLAIWLRCRVQVRVFPRRNPKDMICGLFTLLWML